MANFLSFVFVIGLSVFIHELGHFIFAKRANVYVHEFAIGMGPKLFSKQYGETIYSIRALPVGGFCAMAGEGMEFEKEVPKERFVQEASWWNKFLIYFMGAGFNFLLAMVIMFVVTLNTGVASNEPIIGEVVEGGAAEKAGLLPGDVILEIDGEKIENWSDIGPILEEQIEIIIERNGQIISYGIETEYIEDAKRYVLGISSTTETGFFVSLYTGVTYTFKAIGQMFAVISGLISGNINTNQLAGPVGIYRMAGEQGSAGIISLLSFTAFLSINLGFVNLLPIPAMDGGRILIIIFEAIFRRRLNPKVEYALQFGGFILLMFIIAYVTFNDISRIFG